MREREMDEDTLQLITPRARVHQLRDMCEIVTTVDLQNFPNLSRDLRDTLRTFHDCRTTLETFRDIAGSYIRDSRFNVSRSHH